MVELRAADCYMSDETWTRGLKAFHAFKKSGGTVDDLEILDAETAHEVMTHSSWLAARSHICRNCVSMDAKALSLTRRTPFGHTKW